MSIRCQIVPMPVSPIEHLTVKFQEYLHLPDPGALYVLMGAAAANMIEGNPVWLMLIGPPSCGKSELLNSLLGMPNTVGAAEITSEAAFLSSTPNRERAKDATGGLLRQTGDFGALVLNDFTSLLSKPDLGPIMAAFREIYGGRWTRHTGSDGGRMLFWSGKLAVYAGCTSEIDQHHSLSAKMGERWINFRVEPHREGDYFPEAMASINSESRPEGWTELLSQHVSQFFQSLKLSYSQRATRRELTTTEKLTIYQLAHMAVHCRSGVPRDGYTKEISGVPETEIPTRLFITLAQLYAGMDLIGVTTCTRWKLLLKICMDSMPAIRRKTIELILREPRTVDSLAEPLECCLSTAKRLVQDLEVHGVLRRTKGKVHLTDWMATDYSKLLALQAPAQTIIPFEDLSSQ